MTGSERIQSDVSEIPSEAQVCGSILEDTREDAACRRALGKVPEAPEEVLRVIEDLESGQPEKEG